MTPRRGGATAWLSRVILGVVVLAVYARLYFGFSFYDEAYYLALPYDFGLGHAPFAEERALPQLAALLTQPFIALWVALVGSSEGIVLFARHLYFVVAVATALGVRAFWRTLVEEVDANLIAAWILLYIPFCLPALSYNTFTLFGLLSGSALLARGLGQAHPGASFAGATACLAVVSFSYPPMFFVALPALGLALWWAREEAAPERMQAALRGMLAGGLPALLIGGGLLLAYDFPRHFAELVAFSEAQAVQGGGLQKLRGIFRELAFQRDFLLLLAATLFFFLAPLTMRPAPALFRAIAILLGPALFLVAQTYREFHAPYSAPPFVVSALGLASPLGFLLVRRRFDARTRRGVGVIVVLSIASGLAIWWATSNGLRNAALGFAPASIVTLVCIALSCDGTGEEPGASGGWPTRLALLSLVGYFGVELWTHAYREVPPLRTETTVEAGPWRGLRTTRAADRFVRELQADLDRATERAHAAGAAPESIFFYDYFPAGYLMTGLRPRASTLWTFPLGRVMQGTTPLREAYVEGLRQQAALPDLVVRLACIPSQPRVNLQYREDDPLPAFFTAEGYRSVLEKPCYRIERR